MQIISREEARAQGLNKYFNGEQCVNRHLSERYVSGNGCVLCVREAAKLWHHLHPEIKRFRKKVYYAKHPDALERKYRNPNRKRRNNELKKKQRIAYTALREIGVKFDDVKGSERLNEPLFVRSQDEAIALGFRRFFTGIPCQNGHLSERYVRDGQCWECKKQSRKRRRVRKGSNARGSRPEQKRRRNQRQRLAYRALKELGVNIGEKNGTESRT